MDFLEAAAILIPTLAGLEMTLYDGTTDTLAEFERQYCFSPDLQKIYRALELKAFLESSRDNLIYDLSEPYGSRLMVLKTGKNHVLLGPYVEEGWDEASARILLTRLGASESAVLPYKAYRCKLPISRRDYVLKAALLIAEHIGGSAELWQVKTLYMDAGKDTSKLSIPDAYHDISIINRRYAMEERFIAAVSQGDEKAALKFLTGFKNVQSDLRFVSHDLTGLLTGAAIIRTMIRMGGKWAGLSAVRIDSISQEFAQKMVHTSSAAEMQYLMQLMVKRFCAEVRELRESRYSPCTRKAMDYIDVNLSQPLTMAQIAAAAGVERHLLSKAFAKELHMTVKQYLAKRRCEIAAELLKNSDANVQEVAAYVGYPDNNYFSKVFKAYQGVSPQHYQRNYYFSGK